MEAQNLPRMLYVGDISVEATVAGSVFLYRLLQNYPHSHLRIVESNMQRSDLNYRLPNVIYNNFNIGIKRLLHTRFASLYGTYLTLTAPVHFHKLTRIVKGFQPEAILTVAHGSSWLTAAALAKSLKLPLHLIIHDDWTRSRSVHIPHSLQKWASKLLGDVYRQAQSRLCISSYMVEFYQKQYGVTGNALYPLRAADVVQFDQPPNETRASGESLIFAYAGSLHVKAYRDALVSLSSVLENIGGKLSIYSSLNQESLKAIGLNKNHVSIQPFVPPEKFICTLRNEANVLFVPMSFELEDHETTISFPSKLADYTATGLPILIWGPPNCSAVRWAKENPGVAEVVEEENIEVLTKAVQKLIQDPEYRFYLAKNALVKGREYFSHATVTQQFYQAISSTNSATR